MRRRNLTYYFPFRAMLEAGYFQIVLGLLLSLSVAAITTNVGSASEYHVEDSVPAANLVDSVTAETIKKSIELRLIRDKHDKMLVRLSMRANGSPADVAFDVSLRWKDKSWPVGPLGWKKPYLSFFNGEVDLPVEIELISVVLTPSLEAAKKASEVPGQYYKVPEEGIWEGEPIVFENTKVVSGDVIISQVPPPSAEDSVEYMSRQIALPDEKFKELVTERQFPEALARLREILLTHRDTLQTEYETGCVLMACGDLPDAIKSFLKAKQLRPSPPTNRNIEHQIRRICGMHLYQAVRKNDPAAAFALGSFYQRGTYVGQDVDLAKRYYRNAANAGNTDAMCLLASMYYSGDGAKFNSVNAEQWYDAQTDYWYNKAAALGNESAKRRELLMSSEAQLATDPILGDTVFDYQQWVDRHKSYGTSPLSRPDGDIGEMPSGARLVVSAVTGDGRKLDRSARSFGNSYVVVFGTSLSMKGEVSGFSHSSRGHRGSSGGPAVPAADLERLDQLLQRLPDDKGMLPPVERRMMLQAMVDGRREIRVYDRANMPDAVLEIFRLSQCSVAAWLPAFVPQSEIKTKSGYDGGFVLLSPDGKKVVSAFDVPIQVRDVTTHEFIAEFHGPGDEHHVHSWNKLVFSPDGKVAVIACSIASAVVETETWQIVKMLTDGPVDGVRYNTFEPMFTNDGKHLVLWKRGQTLRAKENALKPLIFKTGTWQRVGKLPGPLAKPGQYLPSNAPSRALTLDSSGTVQLWDMKANQELFSLDQDVLELTEARFSPDQSLVAAVTKIQPAEASRQGFRIRIWKTSDGKLVHEVNFESMIEALAWSPEGRYLLIGIPHSVHSNRSVYAFSLKSGRYRGEFTGSLSSILGMAVMPEPGQLMVGSEDGGIRFWDLKRAIQQMDALENSFTP